MIPCSETCLYQEDGLCKLKKVTKASPSPIKECPYYVGKKDKKAP